tara:strand:+ start:1159 stop:2082 length:924 start_codon:yes stop_codon:yes gene_type:complete
MKPEQDPEVRAGKYTGSNVAGLIGKSRYSSPTEEFDYLRGKPRPDLSDNPYVAAGVWAEEMIGKRFADEMGLKIRFINKTYVSRDWPLATGHIDAKIQGQNVGLEIKTADKYKAKEWSEHLDPDPIIPIEYRCQVNHYLYLTGWDYWWIAVLLGGNDFRILKIERDEEAIEKQVRELKEFHENHILTGLAPEARSPDEALYQFPSADLEETSIEASPLFMNFYLEAKKINEEEKLLKIRKSDNQKNMMNIMEEATYAVDPNSNERLVQWKNGTRSGLDQKALKKEMPELWHEDKFGTRSVYRTFKIL